MQLKIGAHTSAQGGSWCALQQGEEIEATGGIQLFTSNQKQWKGRKISPEEIQKWEEVKEKTGLKENMSHSSYLINLGSPNPEGLQKSRHAFSEEIFRCHALKIPYLNFHPGAATTGTTQACLDTIVESLNLCKDITCQGPTRLLLETTAGQGTSVGYRFEQLAYILKQVDPSLPMGVCIDTCHIFVAGYDIRTQKGWEQVLQEFDTTVGLNYLYAFHVNDSLKDLGSKRDRHAQLGQGQIGIQSFQVLVTHPKTRHLSFYLETPDPQLWKKEIQLLKAFAQQPF